MNTQISRRTIALVSAASRPSTYSLHFDRHNFIESLARRGLVTSTTNHDIITSVANKPSPSLSPSSPSRSGPYVTPSLAFGTSPSEGSATHSDDRGAKEGQPAKVAFIGSGNWGSAAAWIAGTSRYQNYCVSLSLPFSFFRSPSFLSLFLSLPLCLACPFSRSITFFLSLSLTLTHTLRFPNTSSIIFPFYP